MRRYVFLFLFIASATAQAAGERLLFFKVQKDDSEVYLLGSMHLARADIYPLRAEIMDAFAAADALAVEIDISGENSAQIRNLVLSRGMYPPGESLRDHLSAATWAEVELYLSGTGMAPQLFETMRPGLFVTTLESFEMMKLGLRPELGIDLFFLSRARGNKHIIELETVEQQLNILLGIPQADLLVRQTLAQLETREESVEKLVSLWKHGDAAGLQKLIFEDELAVNPEFRSIFERLFDERNVAMSAQVEAFLRVPGRTFVVVGAGHLVGERGIVSLLQNKGFKPQQI